MMRGHWILRRPALACWMVSPEPQVKTLATASPGPGTGSGSFTASNGVFGARNSMAFMRRLPTHCFGFLFARDLVRKPVPTFRDHASMSYRILLFCKVPVGAEQDDQSRHGRPGPLGPDRSEFHSGQEHAFARRARRDQR